MKILTPMMTKPIKTNVSFLWAMLEDKDVGAEYAEIIT